MTAALPLTLAACNRTAGASAQMGGVKGDFEYIEYLQPHASTRLTAVLVERFGCSACQAFVPSVVSIEHQYAARVEFSHLVVSLAGEPDAATRLYYGNSTPALSEPLRKTIYAEIEQLKAERAESSLGADALALVVRRVREKLSLGPATADDATVQARVEAARQTALRWGVHATPTIVVNDRIRLVASRNNVSRVFDEMLS
jgi:protein-disulfide isomerase